MPFDGVPEGVVSDLVKLCIALDGVCRRWSNTSIGAREIGGRPDAPHCTLGWLLVATDWDRDETTRLALDKSIQHYRRLPVKLTRECGRSRTIMIAAVVSGSCNCSPTPSNSQSNGRCVDCV